MIYDLALTGQPYTICLTAGTYALSGNTTSQHHDLSLQSGHLLGAGPGQTILQGSGVLGKGAIIAVLDSQMTGLTVTGGNYGPFTGGGGGVYVAGNLTMTNCEVKGNSAGEGGGIFVDFSSQLVLDGCSITGNVAHLDANGGRGGGVFNAGTLTRTNTTISGNTSDEGPDCYDLSCDCSC